MNLLIEDHPKLLKEYGRVFVWINVVDYMLIGFIQIKDASKTFKQLEENFTLGQKIGLIRDKKWLETELIERLEDLNIDRIILAHGISGEIVVDPQNPHIKSGKFIISHKKIQKDFDETFLQDIGKKAEKLTIELYNVLPIPKKYKQHLS